MRFFVAFLLVLFASTLSGQKTDHDPRGGTAQTAEAAVQTHVVSVSAGGDAAAAVAKAQCGDTIELAAGATYQALTLAALSGCTRWTTIRVAGPLADRRIGPPDAK